MKISLEMARLMLYKDCMATEGSKTVISIFRVSIVKALRGENYIKTCRDAVQIFGCHTDSHQEFPLERELRDTFGVCSIYSGTNEMQRNTIFQSRFEIEEKDNL